MVCLQLDDVIWLGFCHCMAGTLLHMDRQVLTKMRTCMELLTLAWKLKCKRKIHDDNKQKLTASFLWKQLIFDIFYFPSGPPLGGHQRTEFPSYFKFCSCYPLYLFICRSSWAYSSGCGF